MKGLDTNVLVRFLTRDDEVQAERALAGQILRAFGKAWVEMLRHLGGE